MERPPAVLQPSRRTATMSGEAAWSLRPMTVTATATASGRSSKGLDYRRPQHCTQPKNQSHGFAVKSVGKLFTPPSRW